VATESNSDTEKYLKPSSNIGARGVLMICSKCSKVNKPGNNFCSDCGTKLEKKVSKSVQEKSNKKFELGDVQFGKVYLALGLVFLVILGTAVARISLPNRSDVKPAESSAPFVIPSDVLSEDEILALSKTLCPSVNESLSSEANIEQMLAEVKQNSKSVTAATKDAWASTAWKKKNPSWFSGKSYSEIAETNIKATLASNTESLVKPLLNAEEFQGYERSRDKWTWHMFQPVVFACGLTKTIDTLSEYDSKLNTIASQADNLPWYPKGFSEIPGYAGFALGKAGGSCSYSFGSCAIFNIVSQTGCPSSLYVEANGMNSDVVTTWGNDTARVSAGQVARIEISFTENVDTWELTKISCY
jgi:hypothetical protein